LKQIDSNKPLQRTAIPPLSLLLGDYEMKEQEKIFIHELEVFRSEIESTIQFFYAYLTMNACLYDNKQALRIVNKTPLFWQTNAGRCKLHFL
jgi:hypothetical protein